jgi:hypothetical protein
MGLARPDRADEKKPGTLDGILLHEPSGGQSGCGQRAMGAGKAGFEVGESAVLVTRGDTRALQQPGNACFIAAVARSNAAGLAGNFQAFPSCAFAQRALTGL